MNDLFEPVAARYGDPAMSLDVGNDVLRLQLEHRSVRRFTARAVTPGRRRTGPGRAGGGQAPACPRPRSCTTSGTTPPRRTPTSPPTTSG